MNRVMRWYEYDFKKQWIVGLCGLCFGNVMASPLIGVDFSDGFGGSDPSPDDLEPDDSLTVSGWVFPGATGQIIENDANANGGRPSQPVAKFDGVVGPGTPPAVGSAPPNDGIHQFSITVGAVPLDLEKVEFQFSKATGGSNARWLAFRTSLDDSLIFSEPGQSRPTFEKVELTFEDAKYKGLTDQTINFIWYSGGEGSGDIDIDSIVVDGNLDLDVDGDGLNDNFERGIIEADPDDDLEALADVLPGDDLDDDLLSNLEEFQRNTLPLNDDSDGDGLIDGVESNDGTFDDLASDTGTDPLDPDTDDDGLLDGVETNDGSFDGPEKTGSNPLVANTDGDQFRDAAEVLLHGTDPTNPDSQPALNREILLLDGNGTGAMGADQVAIALLEDKFGISQVTVREAATVLPGDETAFDLLVLSSTPGSGDIRGKFQDSPVPILVWEEAVIDNGAGEFGASSVAMEKTTNTSRMTLEPHPITEGLPETIDLYSGLVGETTSTSLVFGSLSVVGRQADLGQAMIIAIEEGDAVDPATGTLDGTAPARRVTLPWTDNSLFGLSADARTLMFNAIDWALGTELETVLQITGIEVDSSSPDGRVTTLEFTGQAGLEYEILGAADLADFADDQAEVLLTVTAQEGTTAAVLNYDLLGIPSDDPRRFFVAREAGP